MRSKMSAIGTSDSVFHDGNPSTGELGTIVTADWLNAVQASTMDLQDELLSVLAAASIANDPAVKTQILAAINKLSKLNMQSGAAIFATDTGVANAYVVSLTPALTKRDEGQVIRFKVTTGNNGACTVTDGVGIAPLVGLALSALQGGEMVAGGYAWIQWHPYVGTGSYVLLFCSGAPMQVANSIKSQHAVAFSQLTSVVGSARNLKCSVTAAASTATFTADELIVETALGGLKYQISNLSKTINLATTGAGGMDTGSAPASGFVAVYTILNTTTGATALLGVNATSVAAPEVYGGSNMPSGYTASALISVWPTNSSGQFIAARQFDRQIIFNATLAATITVEQAALTALSLSSLIPLNAKYVGGYTNQTSTAGTGGMLFRFGTAAGFEIALFGGYVGATGVGIYNQFDSIPVDSQLVYWRGNVTGGITTVTIPIYVSKYSF